MTLSTVLLKVAEPLMILFLLSIRCGSSIPFKCVCGGDSIVVLGVVEGELGSQSTSLAADSVGEL